MKHPERVEDYLEHIAEAIDRATGYLQPVADLAAFRKKPQVQDAVVRNIEIIGEAVTKIQNTAPDFIKQHSALPWAQMRGMRNIAIHVGSTTVSNSKQELLLIDKQNGRIRAKYLKRFRVPAMTTVTISLPESLKAFIDRQLATKGYGNVSEYFRSLLREAQQAEEDARLEALLLEGLAGGADIPLTREFWKELKSEAQQIAAKHRARKRL